VNLDRQSVRMHFDRAARSYDAAAVLQHEVEARLQERLDALKTEPARILDVGAGPGRGALQLQQKYPTAQVIALDLSPEMLRAAKRNQGWFARLRRPLHVVCASAEQLPLPERSVDLLYSNLCMQWVPQLQPLLQEWRRVLKPGAMLLVSSFGPDTLSALRAAWASVDDLPHVNQFFDMHTLGDALLAQGFRDPVLESDRFTLRYPDLASLLKELKAIGATNADQARAQGLGGRKRFAAMQAAYPKQDDASVLAGYEVIYAQAFAPPEGAPIKAAQHDIASVAIDVIPIRRKAKAPPAS
jgi:malonyl-CoA O-methyltransferase